MRIRPLKKKDAEYMLEWMHDSNVTTCLFADFENKTIEDCEEFIKKAQTDPDNRHFAIVDDNDEYMGTVSLKRIDSDNRDAEFAIAIRSKAMGAGYSAFGMKQIIEFGFENLELDRIYWNVYKHNDRAVKFYNKNGFRQLDNPPKRWVDHLPDDKERYYWYTVDRH